MFQPLRLPERWLGHSESASLPRVPSPAGLAAGSSQRDPGGWRLRGSLPGDGEAEGFPPTSQWDPKGADTLQGPPQEPGAHTRSVDPFQLGSGLSPRAGARPVLGRPTDPYYTGRPCFSQLCTTSLQVAEGGQKQQEPPTPQATRCPGSPGPPGGTRWLVARRGLRGARGREDTSSGQTRLDLHASTRPVHTRTHSAAWCARGCVRPTEPCLSVLSAGSRRQQTNSGGGGRVWFVCVQRGRSD